MTLFAHETEFWLRLQIADLFSSAEEYQYAANDISQTEAYSTKLFPFMETFDHLPKEQRPC